MISFIIIGRNIEKTIKICLESVVRFIDENTIIDNEILYIDSNSNDQSIEIAKNYPVKIFQIVGEVNAAIGRNVGANNAKGETLFFIDGDMELLPGFFNEVFTLDGDVAFYPFIRGYHHHLHYDNDFKILYTNDDPLPDKPITSAVTGGLMIISRAMWIKIGGMDERLVRNQDVDLLCV